MYLPTISWVKRGEADMRGWERFVMILALNRLEKRGGERRRMGDGVACVYEEGRGGGDVILLAQGSEQFLTMGL